MDKLRIRFEVMAIGSTSFHSNKTNRYYQRMRLIGFALDDFGGRVPCTADMGFDVNLTYQPKSGETCILVLDALSTRGAMSELTFGGVEPLPAKK